MFFKRNIIIVKYFSLKLTKFILLSWIILIGIISTIDFSDLYNKTRFKESISIGDILIITIENMPARADNLLLYAVLFGSVFCFLELRKSQEFISLQLNGFSIWQSFTTIILVPIILGIMSILFLNPIMAITQKIHEVHNEQIFKSGKKLLTISTDGLWLRDKSNIGNILIQGKYLDTNLGKIKRPIFFLQISNEELGTRIDADWAQLSDGEWILENAKINGQNFNTNKNINIKSNLIINDLILNSSKPNSLSIFELFSFIKTLDKTGIPSIRHRIYLHNILSKPLAFIGITALTSALIFGWFSRTPSTKMTIYALSGGFFYFFIQRLFTALGTSEQMPILISGWLPSIILFGTGLFFLALTEEI